MRLYRLGLMVCAAVLRVFFGEKVEGTELVPRTGPFVLTANHVSLLDPPALGVASPRPVHFMAKAELFTMPVFGWLLGQLGAFPVHRGASDRKAIRHALGILADGGVVGVFPEGTRNRTGGLLTPQGGAALLALKAGVPVVPAAIIGTRAERGFLGIPKPRRVIVVFGEPLHLGCPEKIDRQAVGEGSRRIMQAVAELLAGQANSGV